MRACDYATLNGYFGVGPKAPQMLADYPHGGYAEYLTAPQYSLVRLPPNVTFEEASRWGYLGTGYSALRRAGVTMSTTVLVNGISGTLGLGAALFALALGAPLILGVGRDAERLAKVKALSPERIHVLSTADDDQPVAAWARSLAGGDGADVVIDALPTFSPPSALLAAAAALARGGTHVNIGGVLDEVPIHLFNAMNNHQAYFGSFWFTTAQGQEMADLAGSGAVRLDAIEHQVFSLEKINDAFAVLSAGTRDGGFTNYVIAP